MREAKRYVGTHEFDKKTQRMVRFVERDVKRSEADFPYVYISKGLWDHLGQPYIMQIIVEPVLPPEDDGV